MSRPGSGQPSFCCATVVRYLLSVDAFNASRADLVTVVPVTSKARQQIPSRVEIAAPEAGLKATSYVIGEQVRTISVGQLVKRLGAVSPGTMAKTADVVGMILGL